MKSPHKAILLILLILIIFLGAFLAYKGFPTYHAHDTFDGYCKWRGLVVESKESDYGMCKNIITGKKYKIVLYQGRWFLDGDLPCGFLCF